MQLLSLHFRRALRGALLSLCLLTAISVHGGAADDPRDAQVDQDMQRLKTATLSKDTGTMIDMMYQPVVVAGGGKDNLVAQSKSIMDLVTFTSFDVVKPYTYASSATNDYVVVPTHILLKIGDRQIDSQSYELGIKPHQGSQWQYLDGSGIKPPVRQRFLSDLPADMVLPQVKMTPITSGQPASTAPVTPSAPAAH
jgi:hypothetical protein